MHPEIWGPSGWIFLHTITFNYPINPTPEQKIKHKELFENCSLQRYPADDILNPLPSITEIPPDTLVFCTNVRVQDS